MCNINVFCKFGINGINIALMQSKKEKYTRKGKPAERPRRKAAGLNPDFEGQDGRATEGNDKTPLVVITQRRFFWGIRFK